MTVKNLTHFSGGSMSRKIQKIKYPIALLCVNDFCRTIDGNYNNSHDYQHKFDGVIILYAWDEEANIPEIKNNLLN